MEDAGTFLMAVITWRACTVHDEQQGGRNEG